MIGRTQQQQNRVLRHWRLANNLKIANGIRSTERLNLTLSHKIGTAIPYEHPYLLTIRTSSVFSRWSNKEWHHPQFLNGATVKEKEAWLESLLQSNQNAADEEAFLLVLKSLASEASKEPGASRRAERWMIRLKELRNLEVSAEHYAAVIQSWANSSNEMAMVTVNRAERWINDLNAESEANPRIYPTIECYNAYLDACTKGRHATNKRKYDILEDNARRAESVLRRLHSEHYHNPDEKRLVPNTESFNYVIRGWSRCRKNSSVAPRILSLVRLMESYQRENPIDSAASPNTKTYVMAMDAVVSLAKMKARKAAKGESKKNPSENGLNEIREAEAILSYMHDLCDAGVEGVVPNEVAYNVILSGWSILAGHGHHDAPFEAEHLLRKMMSLKDNGYDAAIPDRLSYEKVIHSWANSGHPNAGKRACWWLKKLWNDAELEDDADFLPNANIYNRVMEAVAVSEGAEETENILRELGEKFQLKGLNQLCPNSESFSVIIRAWLREVDRQEDPEDRIESLQRASDWLGSLRDVEEERDLSTAPELFLGVLKAAEKCARRRPEVLKLATKTMEDFRNSRHGASHVGYTTLMYTGIKVYSGPHDVEKRKKFIAELLEECSDDGLVSGSFVRGIANSDVYRQGWTVEESVQLVNELFGDWPLPLSWTRNVPEMFLPVPADAERQNHNISGSKFRR